MTLLLVDYVYVEKNDVVYQSIKSSFLDVAILLKFNNY